VKVTGLLLKVEFQVFWQNLAFQYNDKVLNIGAPIKPTVQRGVGRVVNEGRGRLFRRKDGKYLIYIPKDLAEDSMFPFKGADSIFVKVSFKVGDTTRLLIEKWKGS